MNVWLALTGVIPAILAMWYVDRLDAKRPEPPRLRRLVAFVGMLSVIPALILGGIFEHAFGEMVGPGHTYNGAIFQSYVRAAFVEELCKIGVVYWVVWRRPEFDERMDGIVYAVRAGLGFALVENFFYLLGAQDLSGFITLWLLRACLAVPGHAMWTGMIGALAARRRFDGRGVGLLGGFLLAVFFHGTYDACIFIASPLNLAGNGDLAVALLGGPVVMTIAAALVMRRLSRTAAHLDDADALVKERAASAHAAAMAQSPYGVPPGHAYGQVPYGQQPYGQPPYGQPPYQQPHGQPPHGPVPGQPAYGQPPYQQPYQPPYQQPAYGPPPGQYGQPPYQQPAYGPVPGQPAYGQPPPPPPGPVPGHFAPVPQGQPPPQPYGQPPQQPYGQPPSPYAQPMQPPGPPPGQPAPYPQQPSHLDGSPWKPPGGGGGGGHSGGNSGGSGS